MAAAVKAGDYDAATAAFGTYVKKRQGLDWYGGNASPKYNQEMAKAAVRGEVQAGPLPPLYAFPGGKIDWFYNATRDNPKYTLDYGWQWQLNRMEFWSEMAKAYLTERDESYAKAWVGQLRSWVAQCPVPVDFQEKDSDKKDFAWRPIEAGLRMGHVWPDAFFAFVQSPTVTNADLLLFYRSILDHARFLQAHHTDVNWLLMEMNGLATAGCFFYEFQEAPEWRAFAFNMLMKEMKHQFLPDGAQFELSTGYHNDVAINNILRTVTAAQRSGFEKELPASFTASLEKAFDWTLGLMTPDLNRPKINDAWTSDMGWLFRKATLLFPQREDYLWVASGRKEGATPKRVSTFLDWSGFAAMRSDWTGAANLLIFDVGPLGYGGHMGIGHAHQDKLNVSLWAYGREILFDGGGGNYEESKWRWWARSTYSHNCLIVDGRGQCRGNSKDRLNQEQDPSRVSQKPIEARWESTPVFDYATGIYNEDYSVEPPEWSKDRTRPVSHRREVLFLKPDLYIVVDTVKPLDEKSHIIQARWQLLSTRTVVQADNLMAMTQDEGKPNLAIVPLMTSGLKVEAVSGQETPEILGWNVRRENPRRVPATTLLHTREGSGTQQFLTLLLPVKSGESNPVARIIPGNPVQVQLKDGRHWRLSTSPEGGVDIRESLPDGATGRSARGGF